jgi:hypothetical protein
MKSYVPIVVCLMLLMPIAATAATPAHRATEGVSGSVDGAARRELQRPVSLDETLIRSAYVKMTAYNRAHYVHEWLGENAWLADNVSMKFELSDFATGNIDNIRKERLNRFVTAADGDIIRGTYHTKTIDGVRYFAYPADWEPGHFSDWESELWTVGDMLAMEAESMHNVSKYVVYTVTVSFQGRSRTYRALAVYDNRFDAANDFRPRFLDNVVGRTGELTTFAGMSEQPLDRARSASVPGRLGRITTQAVKPYTPSYINAAVPMFGCQEHVTCGTTSRHGATISYAIKCEAIGDYDHTCDAVANATSVTDVGSTVWGAGGPMRHYGVASIDANSSSGSREQSVKCAAGGGVVVVSCATVCGVSVGFKAPIGAEASWTGPLPVNIFNQKDGRQHECRAQPTEEEPDPDEGDDCELVQNPDETQWSAGSELTTVSTECGNNSPIVIDINGDGFALTSASNGVPFDINGDGWADRLSWTAAGSDDGFLVLDRNANGTIDNGRELFGNFTPQLPGSEAHGFRALAVYDRVVSGGNADGVIDDRDGVFADLRLWQDANHNGVSEASELHRLADLGVERLHLDYKTSKKADDHGNEFRYRAKVDGKGSDIGRWAWDVFLVKQ